MHRKGLKEWNDFVLANEVATIIVPIPRQFSPDHVKWCETNLKHPWHLEQFVRPAIYASSEEDAVLIKMFCA